ncbi:trypsin-like serine protease [Coemansia reversa NRRL 1564]|uniref:Trypsin-like serine protease n=1 Tax=Coemansia reversa (strain ATCC 12441 / NRRL 1564) TaxID=763665 RepID=A0A2G5B722_COERN|nr:trypsin-like serine protease [Coemansia reversa NRRL 1564]|eukprot:PIA14527.1 trypsin-like serine protease [Coemansia reversa NRRL 1564]
MAQRPRIVGGQTALQKKFSFVANVVSVDSVYTGKNCTGALISQQLVMTTANCLMTSGLTWFNPDLMSVSFGESNHNVYKVHQALISDDYHSNTFSHNVGLIILASPVPESVAIPVKILSEKFTIRTPVFAIGYGMSGSNLNTYPNNAQIVQLSIISDEKCSAYKSFDSTTQLCATGKADSGLCIGDEGAPLVVSNKAKTTVALVGIASYSTELAGTKETVCGKSERVSYFEISRSWTGWISKAANVSYDDIIVSLNITTDFEPGDTSNNPGDKISNSSKDAEAGFLDFDSALSAGIIEGPLPDAEPSLISDGTYHAAYNAKGMALMSLMLLAVASTNF